MGKHYHGKQNPVSIDNTGFGPNSAVEGGRLTNKDGSTNLSKTGIPFWERISVYHTLLRMKRGKFLVVVLLFYTSINIFFATIYYLLDVKHLSGTEEATTRFDQFMEAFFFSSQTLTTVGYGRVAPMGIPVNFVASTESLLGILIFAVVTGLMYGRFARPRAYIKFSTDMLVSPYKDGRALMFRMATYKNNHLTDIDAQVTAALHVLEDGKYVTRFYPLKLEISKINSLALNWTLVHSINEDSPVFGFNEQDFKDSKIEVIVNIKGFDDHFSNIVQQRTSYTVNELVYGAKYIPMFHRSEDRTSTILELDKVNSYEKIALPEPEVNVADVNALTANV